MAFCFYCYAAETKDLLDMTCISTRQRARNQSALIGYTERLKACKMGSLEKGCFLKAHNKLL